ncbi:MAG: hypothetical protein ABR915_18870, partial [Thermoguttaceae bacterium]
MLVLTAVYAGLLRCLQLLQAGPYTMTAMLITFTGCCLAQPLLFGGKKPRKAAIVAGACLFPFVMFAIVVDLVGRPDIRDIRDAGAVLVLIIFLFTWTVIGA